MAVKDGREYRNFIMPIEIRSTEEEEKDYHVRGYATTFNSPYVLARSGDVEYREQVDASALDETNMDDVVFLYNHEGHVFARKKNGTLSLTVDEHGLLVEADLSSTEKSREMYEEIRSGLIDQMSFAFTVREQDYDKDTHTRTITKIDKIYDVSAVSIPANPDTDISAVSARSYVDGVIDAEKAERLERERRLALAKALYFYKTI